MRRRISDGLTLRSKVLFGVLVLFSATLLGFEATKMALSVGGVYERFQQRSQIQTAHLAGFLGLSLWSFDVKTIESQLALSVQDPGILRIQVDSIDNLNPVVATVSPYWQADPHPSELNVVFGFPSVATFQEAILHDRTKIGQVSVVFVFSDLESYWKETLSRVGWEILILSLCLLGFLSILFGRTVEKPLRRITQGIEFLEQGKFDQPVEVRNRDELGTLSRQVNQMASRLEKIYQQKQAELLETETRELEIGALNERLRLATKVGRFGVWDWQVAQGQLEWDETMFQIYGLQPRGSSVSIADWESAIHPSDREETLAKVQAALARGEELDHEFRIVTPRGEERFVKVNAFTTHSKDGQPLRMVGLNLDITDQKRVQNELEQSKAQLEVTVASRTSDLEDSRRAALNLVEDATLLKIQAEKTTEELQAKQRELIAATELATAANKAKSMFLANMSHEIRTPMNAVLGFAQLLTRDPNLSPSSQDKVRTILKSGEHLMSIINGILEMSRIESGKTDVHLEPVDLHTLLSDLDLMFRLRIAERDIQFKVEQGEDLPRYILADLGKTRQILINLLGNAVKFTQQGAISVSVRFLAPRTFQVDVQDSGIGISEQELAKLFRPFERASGGAQIAGGTGLGLAISRDYAHLLGGDITVASQPGVGSRFRFEFQAELAAVAPSERSTATQSVQIELSQGEVRILLVDDNLTNLELLRALLAPAGFLLDEALNGKEAVVKAAQFQPRVILMDMVMPEMNGLEATAQIRSGPLGPEVVIIGLSASVYSEESVNYRNYGLNGYLTKPFREEELFRLLAETAGVRFVTDAREMVVDRSAVEPNGPTSIAPLPEDWKAGLKKAVSQGNLKAVRALAEEVRTAWPEVAGYLLEKAQQYDTQALKKLFSSAEVPHE